MPLILVGSDLVGSLVSSQFLALRAEAASALWIWGVLNSHSGRRFRQQFASGVMATSATRGRLLDLEIPWPSRRQMTQRETRLAEIEKRSHRQEEEAAGTWWRTQDLRETTWNVALATPDREILNRGIPLGELMSRDSPRPSYAPRGVHEQACAWISAGDRYRCHRWKADATLGLADGDQASRGQPWRRFRRSCRSSAARCTRD